MAFLRALTNYDHARSATLLTQTRDKLEYWRGHVDVTDVMEPFNNFYRGVLPNGIRSSGPSFN